MIFSQSRYPFLYRTQRTLVSYAFIVFFVGFVGAAKTTQPRVYTFANKTSYPVTLEYIYCTNTIPIDGLRKVMIQPGETYVVTYPSTHPPEWCANIFISGLTPAIWENRNISIVVMGTGLTATPPGTYNIIAPYVLQTGLKSFTLPPRYTAYVDATLGDAASKQRIEIRLNGKIINFTVGHNKTTNWLIENDTDSPQLYEIHHSFEGRHCGTPCFGNWTYTWFDGDEPRVLNETINSFTLGFDDYPDPAVSNKSGRDNDYNDSIVKVSIKNSSTLLRRGPVIEERDAPPRRRPR